MAFGDLWICPACGALYVEDDQMWLHPDRCPKCGVLLGQEPCPKEEDDYGNSYS